MKRFKVQLTFVKTKQQEFIIDAESQDDAIKKTKEGNYLLNTYSEQSDYINTHCLVTDAESESFYAQTIST